MGLLNLSYTWAWTSLSGWEPPTSPSHPVRVSSVDPAAFLVPLVPTCQDQFSGPSFMYCLQVLSHLGRSCRQLWCGTGRSHDLFSSVSCLFLSGFSLETPRLRVLCHTLKSSLTLSTVIVLPGAGMKMPTRGNHTSTQDGCAVCCAPHCQQRLSGPTGYQQDQVVSLLPKIEAGAKAARYLLFPKGQPTLLNPGQKST